jgi:hypothetical protein
MSIGWSLRTASARKVNPQTHRRHAAGIPARACARLRSLWALSALLVVGLLSAPAVAQAQGTSTPRTPSPPGAAVYFIDLKNGDTVPPKFIVHFGLRNMGVAPAGLDRENTGHHHLLIDTELPPFDEPIPADFNHLHFGGGQTEAEITLPPGKHTLQLLFADKDHVPHQPPVYSERIEITVKEPEAPKPAATAYKRKPSPADAAVYFIYPHDGDYIYPHSTIRFGLTNMGVAPAGVDKPGTGHHHLLVDTDLPPLDQEIPNDFNHLHFGAGQTEVKLELSPGKHTLQLLFADENHVPHDPAVMSKRITVTVDSRGPRARRR